MFSVLGFRALRLSCFEEFRVFVVLGCGRFTFKVFWCLEFLRFRVFRVIGF